MTNNAEESQEENAKETATNDVSSVTFGTVQALTPHDEPDAKPEAIPPPSEDAANMGATAVAAAQVPPRPTLVKQEAKHRIDISTGMRTCRQQSVKQVTNPTKPTSRWEKMKTNLTGAVQEQEPETEADEEAEISTGKKQFRIRSTEVSEEGRMVNLFSSGGFSNTITNYLQWTFQTTFLAVILASFLEFMVLTIVFALGVYAVGSHQPVCVVGLSETNFLDAYHLSWTTLSTVGYGVTSPNIASVDSRCLGINILMAVEAFVGILFGGVTGAIIFSKIARIQSIAQVTWSHPICVRYGTGVMVPTRSNDVEGNLVSDDEDDDEDTDAIQLPCPILEFRLVNDMSNQAGGEIMNASVNVVATTLAAKAEEDVISERMSKRSSLIQQANKTVNKIMGKGVQNTTTLASKGAKTATKTVQKSGAALLGVGKKATHVTGSLVQRLNKHLIGSPKNGAPIGQEEEAKPYSEKELEKELEKDFQARLANELEMAAMMDTEKIAVAVDEGSSSLVPRRIYHSLAMETDTHPFFKRVWNMRHILDQDSPLLSRKARRMIEANGGFWPETLNSYEEVRSNLHFHEIIVSFSGTANASGSSVYSQKVYDFVDVNIGYTFATVLAIEKGKLAVDHVLLNDVKEQYGGGGEPFTDVSVDSVSPIEYAAQMTTAAAMTAADTATKATTKAAEGMKEAIVYTGETVKHTGETTYTTAKAEFGRGTELETVPDSLETVIQADTGEATSSKEELNAV